jgi:hypothetical protein
MYSVQNKPTRLRSERSCTYRWNVLYMHIIHFSFVSVYYTIYSGMTLTNLNLFQIRSLTAMKSIPVVKSSMLSRMGFVFCVFLCHSCIYIHLFDRRPYKWASYWICSSLLVTYCELFVSALLIRRLGTKTPISSIVKSTYSICELYTVWAIRTMRILRMIRILHGQYISHAQCAQFANCIKTGLECMMHIYVWVTQTSYIPWILLLRQSFTCRKSQGYLTSPKGKHISQLYCKMQIASFHIYNLERICRKSTHDLHITQNLNSNRLSQNHTDAFLFWYFPEWGFSPSKGLMVCGFLEKSSWHSTPLTNCHRG